jgi:hypothetical protein
MFVNNTLFNNDLRNIKILALQDEIFSMKFNIKL